MDEPYAPPRSPSVSPPVDARRTPVPHLALSFWGWALLSAALTAASALSGEYWALMSSAVARAGTLPEAATHDAMVWAFIALSLLFFVLYVGLGALLVWRTNSGGTWAKHLLALYASFAAYLEVSETFLGGADSLTTDRLDDWIFAALSVLLMVYVGVRPYLVARALRDPHVRPPEPG